MTFIIYHPDGTREQYSNHYDEDIESERDAAFDDAYIYEKGIIVSMFTIVLMILFLIFASII